jgi:hypothetical protein
MSTIFELRKLLENTSANQPITGELSTEVERKLQLCWDQLDGSDEGGMSGYKLHGGIEALRWVPPAITFEIERHGGTVNGSVYAEIQKWVVDLAVCKATLETVRKRLVGRKDGPLKIKPLAEELAALIVRGLVDRRLKWLSPQRVTIRIGEVIPTTNAWTTSDRRRRFSVAIDEALSPHAWKRVSGHTFERNV